AVIVAVGAHFWLSNQADSTESTVRNFNGKDLRAVMGSASLVNGEAQVTEYENGAAILSTGRTYLKADDYQVAEIHTNPENQKLRTLFWRRAGDPQNLQTLPIAAQETMVYLRNAPEW